MIPRLPCAAGVCVAALVCLIAGTAGAASRPVTLADSTWVDRWQLKNGLEVTARHVPGANGIAVVVAYHVGRNQDPRGRSGLADLMCEVLYTAPAGDVPGRTREDMATLRPLGWNTQVAPRFSLISEVASSRQFPGVLNQVATRLRGVTVTDSVVNRARRTLVSQQGQTYGENPHAVLFARIRDLAVGATDQEIVDRLSGRSISTVTTKEIAARLRKLYVPANAVLSLAGDLDGVDVRTLVTKLFESIPGGTATPEPPLPRLSHASRAIRRPNLDAALLGVGIITPAIRDTTHPGYYLHALLFGQYCDDTWGRPNPPLQSRFRYPVLADEQLMEFFPPVHPRATNPEDGTQAMLDAFDQVSEVLFPPDKVDEIRTGNEWIFGGLLTPQFKQVLRQRAGALHTLASTLAIRALWGSESFWSAYLTRYRRATQDDMRTWVYSNETPGRMVRVLLTPAK